MSDIPAGFQLGIEMNYLGKDLAKRTYTAAALPEECYSLASEIEVADDSIIPLKEVAKEGSIVFAGDGIKIRLGKQVNNPGGEGTIYLTNTPFVAKIYHADHNKVRTKAKIELMLRKRIDCEGICYPVAMLFNQDRQFVGYLMPKADGNDLGRMFPRESQMKYFPDWNRRDLVRMCVCILEKIKYLHDRNIIIGDINLQNIMVKSPEEIYLVDTDSYQVEGFPCPVGKPEFTAPELQDRERYGYLRTKGNESFAIATLLFMIMLMGQKPYTQKGGVGVRKNIKNMEFPYGKRMGLSEESVPEGDWNTMYEILPRRVQDAFEETFYKHGIHSKENTRLDVNKWLEIFQYYLYFFDNGLIERFGPEAIELYPKPPGQKR